MWGTSTSECSHLLILTLLFFYTSRATTHTMSHAGVRQPRTRRDHVNGTSKYIVAYGFHRQGCAQETRVVGNGITWQHPGMRDQQVGVETLRSSDYSTRLTKIITMPQVDRGPASSLLCSAQRRDDERVLACSCLHTLWGATYPAASLKRLPERQKLEEAATCMRHKTLVVVSHSFLLNPTKHQMRPS